jgi:hypothetical protein
MSGRFFLNRTRGGNEVFRPTTMRNDYIKRVIGLPERYQAAADLEINRLAVDCHSNFAKYGDTCRIRRARHFA